MESIRRTGTALLVALAMGVPALASAEQAPFQACDGDKAEHKTPTAQREKQDTTNAKSGQKVDKTDSKQQPVDKTDPSQTDKS
jgi:hypothetical protein